MATPIVRKTLKSISPFTVRSLTSPNRHLTALATAGQPESDGGEREQDVQSIKNAEADNIFIKAPKTTSSSSVTMPTSSMTGSIVGKRFYKQATTREADDGNGWNVMLDYRTLKTPAKRPLKCPTPALAMAIAAEWEYQETDGIRPFTMPLMKLACTALERVPLTRQKIIEHLLQKFHKDLVFCRAPGDSDLTSGILDLQKAKIDPLLDWVKSEFGYKPVVYSDLYGGKQENGLVNAMENLLKNTDDCELAVIDAIAAAAQSLTISIGIFRGRLQIEEAIELIRLEEDFQVDRWGLVEGGHDVDIADLRVQISSATVFLGLSRRH
ncbi:hypothetical protein RJ640_028057 [Escallonia rubra]|uniref:ATP synthase mitochondrial F1 complex assembly factor 2 n=1 Tax=Escallonia rubra TaxID=112253 RepID=A0AA88QJW2_9ASTE|nr:hypothetical protein RJ640_028057 [Escallonia rubra]